MRAACPLAREPIEAPGPRVSDTGHQRWLGPALVVGVSYFVVGFGSAELAGMASFSRMVLFWRWSAFIVCGVVFAAHIAHEHFRLRSSARQNAWHTSVAAALGAFALALAANMHDLGSASGYRPRMLVALAAWPLLTAVPAFLVALVVAAGFGALGRRRPPIATSSPPPP